MGPVALLDRHVDKVLDDEASMVADPPRARRVWLRQIVWGAAVWLSFVAVLWLPTSNPWRLAPGLVLGVFVGGRLLATSQRARAYRRGWLEGRAAMMGALAEAINRDMSIGDWIMAERVRDLSLMGWHVAPPDEDDGGA